MRVLSLSPLAIVSIVFAGFSGIAAAVNLVAAAPQVAGMGNESEALVTQNQLLLVSEITKLRQDDTKNAVAEDRAALFDSGLALMVGELRALIPALLEALGGEQA